MMDRLTSMAVFVKVADAGSFAAAAGALDLSQQMVGKHVAALEARLSARLINRTTRRQSLTELGRAYYYQCRTVLAEVEAADALADQMTDTPRGRLRINAPVTFGSACLAPLVARYMQEHPEVSVDLVLTDRKVDFIEEGFEAVLRIGDLADSSLIARPLAPYRLALCASPAYLARHDRPKHPGDLKDHAGIVFIGSRPIQNATWSFTRGNEAVDVVMEGRFRSNDTRSMQWVAEAGIGLVMGAEVVLDPLIASGRLERLMPDWQAPSWPMHVLYAPDRRQTPKLRAFLDMLVEAFPRP